MNKPWILTPLARIGLFILILGLGLAAIASQTEQQAVAGRFNRLTQTVGKVQSDIEALVWRLPAFEIVVGAALVVLIVLVISLYLTHFRTRSLHQSGYIGLFLLLLLFTGIAWLMVAADYTLLVYLFPAATLSILMAMVFDIHLSILVTALMGFILGFLAGGSLELALYGMMGGFIGVLSMGRVKHLDRVRWSGAYVILSNLIVLLVFHFSNSPSNELLTLIGIGIANGVITTSLTLVSLFLVGNVLGITTSIQFLDLAQPTHPLLRRLLLHAPGTYHHSLMVSNLAEQAAERIGADALLTRVGAYYHDVGKLQHPYFFIENQLQQIDVHDQLDPRTSAQTIIRHVRDGLNLAQKYNLPRAVRAFIAEHHGTSRVEYFYHQAQEQAAEPTQVNEADFRYPGPKPQSKETALVMLADSCEAAVRATAPTSIEELDQLVHHLIIDKASSGQLDECDLTLPELKLAQHTFVEILKGAFHQRVEYPPEIEAKSVALAPPLMKPAPSRVATIPASSTLVEIEIKQ